MNLFKKIDIYYIVTLLFLLLSSNSNFLAASNLWWSLILVFMCTVAVSKRLFRPRDFKIIGIFSLVYLVLVSARDIFINGLETEFLLSEIVFLLKFVYLTFVFCTILKEKAAMYIVNVMVHLTVLSFFFYSLQLLQLGDYIYKFSQALNLQSQDVIPGYTNFLVFTLTKGFHDYTNSGFVWEPGAFGCFLIIALLLQFFLNKFKFDRKANIFIIGIITTASTTNYLALLVVLFLAYRYRVAKINFWAILLLFISAALITTIPLLGGKIASTYYEDLDDLNRLKYLGVFYKHNNMSIPLNRFSSMIYIYNTFGFKLILGVTNKYSAILNKAFDINISNGIFDFLAKFGLVGLIYLLYKYSKFCLAYIFKAEYLIYCLLTLLVLGFGEPVLILPIVLMFIFLPVKQVSEVEIITGGRAFIKSRVYLNETVGAEKKQA